MSYPRLMRFGSILTLAAMVTVADQFSKWWAQSHLVFGASRPVTPFFHLTLVYNTGSAFGFFSGNNKALVILAFLILGSLLYSARGLTERGGIWGAVGVALVMGGAVGNIIDRVQIGQVVDFFDFRIWPVFNVADSAITVGAGCLIIGLWRK
jgi:signal peptidase II